MAEPIKNEQEFTMVYKDDTLDKVYTGKKMFLLSDVYSCEEYVDDWIQKNDPSPKTLVCSTQQPAFAILCPYKDFKKLWLTYRGQTTYKFATQ